MYASLKLSHVSSLHYYLMDGEQKYRISYSSKIAIWNVPNNVSIARVIRQRTSARRHRAVFYRPANYALQRID